MIPKPTECAGCPLYGDGKGFVPDVIVPGARVACVAQNPGDSEEKGERIIGWAGHQPVTERCEPQPLIGRTGWMWEHDLLPLTGLSRDQVCAMNILKCRVTLPNGRKTNDLPTGKTLDAAVQHCMASHFRMPDVALVVAMGSLAVRALSGKNISVMEWRGFLL